MVALGCGGGDYDREGVARAGKESGPPPWGDLPRKKGHPAAKAMPHPFNFGSVWRPMPCWYPTRLSCRYCADAGLVPSASHPAATARATKREYLFTVFILLFLSWRWRNPPAQSI